MNKKNLLLIFILTIVVGCNRTMPPMMTPSLKETITPTAIAEPTQPIPAPPSALPIYPTITPTSTLPAYDILETIPPSLTPPLIPEQPELIICENQYTKFDIKKETDISSYANLYFNDENNLIIEGWASRPEPTTVITGSYAITTTYPFIGLNNIGFSSSRILLKKSEIKLELQEITVNPLSNFLFNTPCPCPGLIEVLMDKLFIHQTNRGITIFV